MRATRALACALAALAAAACSLTPVDVDPRQELLSQWPDTIETAPALAATILVRESDANAPYDTTRMAYSVKPLELAYFARTEWADKPASMLHGLLVRTLERTHRFRAVLVPPSTAAPGYVLDTRLIELRQDFTADPARVTLIVRAELRRGGDSHPGESVIAAREFEAREPMSARSPDAGVVAANAAAARVLADIARFVVASSG
jgi:cholesterol transport system auxiliary component